MSKNYIQTTLPFVKKRKHSDESESSDNMNSERRQRERDSKALKPCHESSSRPSSVTGGTSNGSTMQSRIYDRDVGRQSSGLKSSQEPYNRPSSMTGGSSNDNMYCRNSDRDAERKNSDYKSSPETSYGWSASVTGGASNDYNMQQRSSGTSRNSERQYRDLRSSPESYGWSRKVTSEASRDIKHQNQREFDQNPERGSKIVKSSPGAYMYDREASDSCVHVSKSSDNMHKLNIDQSEESHSRGFQSGQEIDRSSSATCEASASRVHGSNIELTKRDSFIGNASQDSGDKDLFSEENSESDIQSFNSPSATPKAKHVSYSTTPCAGSSISMTSTRKQASGCDVDGHDDDITPGDGDDGGIPTTSAGRPYSQGIASSKLRRAPDCYDGQMPKMEFGERTHSNWCRFMFKLPLPQGQDEAPVPYPHEYKETKETRESHVFMPCSQKSQIPSTKVLGSIQERWILIEETLKKPIRGTFELQDAILKYNYHYRSKWDFENLHSFFCENEAEATCFFQDILPKMQKLALQLPNLCTRPLPLLKQDAEDKQKIVMSQQQAACLLANAFFCTYPGRNARMKNTKLSDINFSNLFSGRRTQRKIEKLKCIIHYFKRVMRDMPTGVISFVRQRKSNSHWMNESVDFTDVHVTSNGTIEDHGQGMLQADFANKHIGGGVLGNGCVQEEIRFMICPEMIVSRLFTEVLSDQEVLIMKGCERFSDYTGYSDSFKWKGDHRDETERDSWRRLVTEVVAMDAIPFRKNKEEQFSKGMVHRELRKAYCAFTDPEHPHDTRLPAVATGNWGCGAFGGNVELKAMIQMIAASHANREVCYFTFGNKELCDDISKVNSKLKDEYISTKDVLERIDMYHSQKKHSKQPLFDFILKSLGIS